MKQIYILLLIMFTNCGISTIDHINTTLNNVLNHIKTNSVESELFFGTQFLTKYDLVAQTLIETENFSEVYFYSLDGIKLHGLLRKKPDAPYSIIFCAGFYPGRKEGLATFIKLVPENINILFFDARGHGSSEGRIFHQYF